MVKECREKAGEVDQLVAEIQMERNRQRQLERVMQEAAIILRHILTVKTHSSTCFPAVPALLYVPIIGIYLHVCMFYGYNGGCEVSGLWNVKFVIYYFLVTEALILCSLSSAGLGQGV